MEAQDYPVRHFEQMARLAESFRELPAQVEQHSYSYESFGSWAVIVRFKDVRLRVSFDGRDSVCFVERSESRKPPDKWGPARLLPASGEQAFPLSPIIAAVVDSAG
jgi:hypothetical protein